MKKLLYILSIVLLTVSTAFAVSEEPAGIESELFNISADWEREADARIWSERVVSDFKSGSLQGFRLNALCDESAFDEIEKIKSISLDIIKGDIDSGRSSNKGALALKIFERGNEYLPASDESSANADIALFKSLPCNETFDIAADITGAGCPEMPVIQYGISAGVTTGTGSVQLKKHGSDSCSLKTCHFKYRSSLNLSLLWDREKGDFYRIFLYIRDDDRIKDLSLNIIYPSPVLLRHLHFTNSNIRTELHSKRELHNKINLKLHTVERYIFTAFTQTVSQSNPDYNSVYTSGAVI